VNAPFEWLCCDVARSSFCPEQVSKDPPGASLVAIRAIAEGNALAQQLPPDPPACARLALTLQTPLASAQALRLGRAGGAGRSGEALSFDYATTEWDMSSPFACSCGAGARPARAPGRALAPRGARLPRLRPNGWELRLRCSGEDTPLVLPGCHRPAPIPEPLPPLPHFPRAAACRGRISGYSALTAAQRGELHAGSVSPYILSRSRKSST